MKLLYIVPLFSLLFTLSAASIFRVGLGGAELEMEFEPYYMPLGLTIPLTSSPVSNVNSSNETDLYGYLLGTSLMPRFIILEASAYPMPLVGVGIKKFLPDVYNACNVFNWFNIVDSIAAGPFMEPWGVSLFIGNVAHYTAVPDTDDAGAQKNSSNAGVQGSGYFGLLVSYGSQHIRFCSLVPDHWVEFEIKLKGVKSGDALALSWSYRLGYRLHMNPDIRSYVYAGVRRDHLDSDFFQFSLVKNSHAEFRLDVGTNPLEVLTVTAILGKKFPLNRQFALELNAGCIWYVADSYSGGLSDGASRNALKFVISPNVKF
ncbi:MAG: hypothetical protein HZC28_16110 [Spirochaetes bacterium]|nr:hypothetical protein [Spirochaetota bacterium]